MTKRSAHRKSKRKKKAPVAKEEKPVKEENVLCKDAMPEGMHKEMQGEMIKGKPEVPMDEQAHEFLSEISSLRESEADAQKILEKARQKAAKIEADAREKAVEITVQADEKAVDVKNRVLAQERGKIQGEIDKMLASAKKEAEKIKSKRLDGKDVKALAESVLGKERGKYV